MGGAERQALPRHRGPIAAAEGWVGDALAAVKLAVVRHRVCEPAWYGRLLREPGTTRGKWRARKVPG